MTNKAARDYQRMLFAGASDEQPDRQGRITIPALLREYASLSHDCVVIGNVNRLEIWDEQAWQTYSQAQEESFSELADEVVPGLDVTAGRTVRSPTRPLVL